MRLTLKRVQKRPPKVEDLPDMEQVFQIYTTYDMLHQVLSISNQKEKHQDLRLSYKTIVEYIAILLYEFSVARKSALQINRNSRPRTLARS